MTNHTDWHIWADQLDRLGISDWVASMLEAAGPMTLLGAQMVYICQPFLNRAVPQLPFDSLLGLLEEPDQAQSFAALLRKEYSR